MSLMSGKIDVVKTMPWPVALVISVAIIVIGVISAIGRDVTPVLGAILLLMGGLGYAELREIKSNTNGTNNRMMDANNRMMDELAEYRRAAAISFRQAMENPAVPPRVEVLLPPPQEIPTQVIPRDSHS
jgi:hypothetical protein